jgi:hypothetical protein
VSSFDAGEAPRRSTSSLGAASEVTALITPTLADSFAKCVIFGALPLYGFYLFYLSVAQALRSGKVLWFTPSANFILYKRVENPTRFWVVFSTKLFMHFVLCAVPFLLFACVFLPQLIDLLRFNHNGP